MAANLYKQCCVSEIKTLLHQMNQLRGTCLAMEQEFEASISEARPQSRPSAKNLIDYLALRKHELRDLQFQLAAHGLSSLGHSESSVLAALDAVIGVLESLSHKHPREPIGSNPGALKRGTATLARNAHRLLGPLPKGRRVRIMVTLPSEAAESYELIRSLIAEGTDVVRINCAHDFQTEWESMVTHVRNANQECGRDCKILMDLAGPKLRTGSTRRGGEVARWRVSRDVRGNVIVPARIALVGESSSLETLLTADLQLPAPNHLLHAVRVRDTIKIKDSLGKTRELTVIAKHDHACLCTCSQGAFVMSKAKATVFRKEEEIASGHLGDLPFVEEPIHLHPGDLLVLTRAEDGVAGGHRHLPHIACTLPEVFNTALPGQPIFFDDGKLEGRICEVNREYMVIEMVHTGAGEGKLGSEKGINFPETQFKIGALTDKDRQDLTFVAEHADIVGLSFVRRPEDIAALLAELEARAHRGIGIILKIENREGFENLPLIMMAALRHHPVGIMVARGDLAIEVGFERLAEVQEEILWLSEAAHMPVVWATQVLETLTKTGIPSRAEVTDAAMGVRAECVMLNKGRHILDSVRFLDGVLHRMRAHHLKKRSMLRRLRVAQIKQAAAS